MNYKKYLILLLSISILVACKKLPVDEIQDKVDRKIYYDALYLMNKEFEKSTPNNEKLKRYQKIYISGRKYYLSKNDLKKVYNIDKLYLKLPSRIRAELSGIQVDINKHKEDGKRIARDHFNKTKLMKENTYREKVEKYREYGKGFGYDEDMKDIISAEQKRLEAKIEKKLDYRVIGGNDELLNSMIEEDFEAYIEHNPFTKSKEKPDVILEITPILIKYIPNEVKVRNYHNDYEETYTTTNGKEVKNQVKYITSDFTKSTYMEVMVKYKLTSTLTGEIILEGNKTLDNMEFKNWTTNSILSGEVIDISQFPSNEIEKNLPEKRDFFSDMAIKILREINKELKNLPDYDYLKIYIS